jgi:CopG family nickel-responsive transcriptional regulator
MEKVVRSGVSLNSELLKRFDEVIEEKGYVNRSKAIKDLIRNFLISEEWEKGKEVLVLKPFYMTTRLGVDERLIDIQHTHHAHHRILFQACACI